MRPEAELLLNQIHDEGIGGEREYGYVTATLGIDYALGTGRVGGPYALAFDDLSEAELRSLIDRIAAECDVMADVPRWLIANLDPARAHRAGEQIVLSGRGTAIPLGPRASTGGACCYPSATVASDSHPELVRQPASGVGVLTTGV